MERGFTLIELLIGMSILSLLVLIGLPAYSQLSQQQAYQNEVRELHQALKLTRALAVNHNQRAIIKPKQTWQNGWIIFIDKNNNGELDADELLYRDQGPLNAAQIQSDSKLRQYISFIGTGEAKFISAHSEGAIMMGSLLVCAKASPQVKKLFLSRGGRSRIDMAVNESCS